MKKFLTTLMLAVLGTSINTALILAQSPNERSAITKLEASALQSRTERGQSNGYVPLGSYVTPIGSPGAETLLISPRYTFPGFVGASNGAMWVKSGSGMAVLGGVSYASNLWTSNNVSMGLLTSGIYGVKIDTGASPLFLRGGSGNKVIIDYNNTLGGSDSGRTGLLWYIGNSGGFKLAAGEFNGSLDWKGYGATNVLSLAGANSTLVLSNPPSLTSNAGNFTFSLAGGAGVIVPSTASGSHVTFALNVTSANTLYAQLGANNTLTGINTFSQAPVVPNASFTIAKTSGLQAALDTKDAILTFSSPLSRSTNTISIARSSGSVNGYLHAEDFTLFSAAAAYATAFNGYGNGYLPIGNGSGLTKARLTSTDNSVTITNGSGSIDLSVANPAGFSCSA